MLTSSYVSSEDIRHVEPLSPAVMRVFKGGKRRKLTHAEKKEKLKEEIRLLESGVAVLKTRDLPPSLAMKKDPVLLPMTVKYSALLYSMHTQQLQVAKMQAALSRCLTDQQHYPLYSHINLSKDWKERRETLVAMRDHKIRTALEFVMSPGSLDDPLKQQFSENQFENDDGDICCVRFETIQFPQVKSLEQVYEALSFYKNNMEIIISEELGHITIRDDYDDFHEEVFHTRIISTNESGITTEGNVVSFRALLSENEGGYKGQPCAVMVADSVDEDEKYPYLSHKRVRKDLSTAVVLTENRRDTDNNVVVTMRRAAFYKIRQPDFPISFCEFENLRYAMAQWSDVMLKSMRGILYPSRS